MTIHHQITVRLIKRTDVVQKIEVVNGVFINIDLYRGLSWWSTPFLGLASTRKGPNELVILAIAGAKSSIALGLTRFRLRGVELEDPKNHNPGTPEPMKPYKIHQKIGWS